MSNEIHIFNNPEFGDVRTLTIDNEPFFVGKDVASILGYERDNKAVVDHVDEEDRKMVDGKTQSHFGIELGQRGGWLINESGVYSLVFSSKLPAAKQFKRWVTSEVLPAIRKTGSYNIQDSYMIDDPVARAKRWIEEETKRQEQAKQITEMTPKAIFADAVSASKSSILIGDLAKILKGNGIETGQKRLFSYLRDNGYLIKGGSSKNMPTQKAMERGLFEIKETTINNPDGSIRVTKTTKVTGKGQQYFVNKFLDRSKKA